VLVSFVYVVACRLFALVLLLGRSDGSKELEIILLRHELAIRRRHTRRPQLTAGDRLVLATLSRGAASSVVAGVPLKGVKIPAHQAAAR
jgi:putative transposase